MNPKIRKNKIQILNIIGSGPSPVIFVIVGKVFQQMFKIIFPKSEVIITRNFWKTNPRIIGSDIDFVIIGDRLNENKFRKYYQFVSLFSLFCPLIPKRNIPIIDSEDLKKVVKAGAIDFLEIYPPKEHWNPSFNEQSEYGLAFGHNLVNKFLIHNYVNKKEKNFWWIDRLAKKIKKIYLRAGIETDFSTEELSQIQLAFKFNYCLGIPSTNDRFWDEAIVLGNFSKTQKKVIDICVDFFPSELRKIVSLKELGILFVVTSENLTEEKFKRFYDLLDKGHKKIFLIGETYFWFQYKRCDYSSPLIAYELSKILKKKLPDDFQLHLERWLWKVRISGWPMHSLVPNPYLKRDLNRINFLANSSNSRSINELMEKIK